MTKLTRARLPKIIFLIAWFVSVAFCASSFAAERPNVVFLLADDLGYGDLGCYGREGIRTPNLDRLAAQGVRFTSHYANGAECTPTRVAFLTGRYLYWDFAGHGGQLALRRGVWKGVKQNLKENVSAPLELYDLSQDPGESRNIAKEHPEVVSELEQIMLEGRKRPGIKAFSFGKYGS